LFSNPLSKKHWNLSQHLRRKLRSSYQWDIGVFSVGEGFTPSFHDPVFEANKPIMITVKMHSLDTLFYVRNELSRSKLRGI
jgi:hypothetical protein